MSSHFSTALSSVFAFSKIGCGTSAGANRRKHAAEPRSQQRCSPSWSARSAAGRCALRPSPRAPAACPPECAVRTWLSDSGATDRVFERQPAGSFRSSLRGATRHRVSVHSGAFDLAEEDGAILFLAGISKPVLVDADRSAAKETAIRVALTRGMTLAEALERLGDVRAAGRLRTVKVPLPCRVRGRRRLSKSAVTCTVGRRGRPHRPAATLLMWAPPHPL